MMKIAYPAARRSAASYVLHGKTIPEPYDYLEDPANEETKKFVEAQNSCFRSYMESSDDLRSKILKSVSNKYNYARTSPPSLRNGNYFFSHNTGLQNQNVIKRTTDLAAMSTAEVFLDPNTLSADGTSALSSTGWSKDETFFAYCVNEKGSDWQHIRVKRFTGEDLSDDVQWAKFSVVSWWHNEGFFYTRYPSLSEGADKGAETDCAKDAFICFHKVGTDQAEDVTVLAVPEEPLWNLSATVSDCHEYLIITVNQGCDPKNLLWVAKLPPTAAGLAGLSIKRVINEFVGEYSYIGNDGPLFYLTSTKAAPRKKVVTFHVETSVEADLIPEGKSVLSGVALAKNTLLLTYLEDVKDVLYYRRLGSDATLHKVELPIGTIISMFTERKLSFVSFKVSSFLLPGRIYLMDIEDPIGSLRVLMDDQVEGLNADDYLTEQRFYHSDDGTKIPLFIVRKKGAVSAQSPLLLSAYGGFNISLTPTFNPLRLTYLMHLGGVFALPNIRGGGEYGEDWHNAGRLKNKQNCFTDFIAAAKYLHKEQIGSPATTAIMGGSNGGLLVAATANQAPSLYSCVICMVGVLDMFKFHKFTIGHAWKSDYGNPDEEEDFQVVAKYSPIHNVKENTKYPAILVMTGDHDDRVVPLHSLKYIATMQHANPSLGGPLLARVEVAAGHGAGKPTSKIVEETADVYTFIAKHTGAGWTD